MSFGSCQAADAVLFICVPEAFTMVFSAFTLLTCVTFQLDPVPEFILAACRDNNVLTTILVHYTLTVAKQGSVGSVVRILPILAKCEPDTVFSDMSLHELVSYLAAMGDSFANLDFCEVVFDKFFLVSEDLILVQFSLTRVF